MNTRTHKFMNKRTNDESIKKWKPLEQERMIESLILSPCFKRQSFQRKFLCRTLKNLRLKSQVPASAENPSSQVYGKL